MKKVILAIVCIAVFLVALFLGMNIFKNTEEPQGNNVGNINSISKEEFSKSVKSFTIRFSSVPYDTEVKYNFEDKTKTIIHYTSGTWNHTDQMVTYENFDKLLDYLYNTVSVNAEEIHISSNPNTDTGAQPYYNMYIEFNTEEAIPVFSHNWSSYKNNVTNDYEWALNGYKLPSYWNEFLGILEIDETVLSEGIRYDFNDSKY